MNILDWSYLGLLMASLMGAILFFGYTFRIKIAYPFVLVSLHLTVVGVTFILFTAAFIHIFQVKTSALEVGFFTLSYVVFVLTLVTGLFFFLRYDLRRKIMRLPLVSTHLVMAVVTFICFTGLIGLADQRTQVHTHAFAGRLSPGWYSFHRHQTMRNITHPSNP